MYTKNVDHNLIIEPKFTFLSFLLPQYSIFSLVYLEIPWYAFWALNLDSILLDVAWMLLTLFFYIVLTLKGSCSHLSKKKRIFTNYSVNIKVYMKLTCPITISVITIWREYLTGVTGMLLELHIGLSYASCLIILRSLVRNWRKGLFSVRVATFNITDKTNTFVLLSACTFQMMVTYSASNKTNNFLFFCVQTYFLKGHILQH